MTETKRKNIVLCLDGTGNEYGSRNTNVLLLHKMLEQSDRQVSHYDPGVGTFGVGFSLRGVLDFRENALRMAFGYGLRQNAIDAYGFVAEHYRPGDRIYIFGFSRGAYIARLVAALIHGLGILPSGYAHLVPHGLRYLQMGDGRLDFRRLSEFSQQFRTHRSPNDIFLGTWDTVASVNWAFDRQVYAFTRTNRSVSHVRHAIAVDEQRAFFVMSRFRESVKLLDRHQDRLEVLFPGVHSDVGGGYPGPRSNREKKGIGKERRDETGLSKVALEWMVVEARKQGLRIHEDRAFKIFGESPPDPLGPRHQSLRGPWWVCELWPQRRWDEVKNAWSFRINHGRRRGNLEGLPIHESIQVRERATGYSLWIPGERPEVVKREPFESDLGGRSLEAWEEPAGSPKAEDYDSPPLTQWIVALVSLYGLITAPLFWVIYEWRGPGSAVKATVLWPAWVMDRVIERPRILVALVFPAAFGIGAAVLGRMAPLWRETSRTRGRLPHLTVLPEPVDVAQQLVDMKPEGRVAYASHLRLDTLFIPAYGGAYALAWWLADLDLPHSWWLLMPMAIGMVADFIENSSLLSQLRSPGEAYSLQQLRIASWATTVKMLGVGLAVLLLTAEILVPGILSRFPWSIAAGG